MLRWFNGHQEQVEWMQKRNLLHDEVIAMDIGCYDGRFLAQMPGSISKIGVDIDSKAIESSRQKFLQANINSSAMISRHFSITSHLMSLQCFMS